MKKPQKKKPDDLPTIEEEEPTEFSYPYNSVACTVEWFQIQGKDNLKITDSRISYSELRDKAPQLLCDFFEKHMVFVPKSELGIQ